MTSESYTIVILIIREDIYISSGAELPFGLRGGGLGGAPDVFTNFHDIYIFATFFFFF
jgi:hypothetical protein